MGILTVVEQVATTYKPSQNDNIFVVTAPTGVTSQNNVKILADVKDGSGNLLARLKAPIYYGTTNKAVFNISQILCDYVGTDWDFNDTESKDCQTQRFGYQVAFGYEYSTGTTSPIVPVSGDTTISSRTVFNAVLDPFEWLDYDQADYLMASGSTANFLTNNFNKRIHIDQKEWLYALHGSSISRLEVIYGALQDNLIRNSLNSNAVIGTPGTLPTLWAGTYNAGLSRQIVSLGVENNLPYMDIRFFGTANDVLCTIIPDANIPASLGDSINLSGYFKWVNGSRPTQLNFDEFNGAGYLNTQFENITITSTLTKFTSNKTITNGSTTNIMPYLVMVLTVGQTYDFTIRVAGFQLNKNNNTNFIGTSVELAKSGTICRFPIGANIPSGIPVGTKSYTISPKNSGGVAVGSPYTITIDDRCSKYPSIYLFFVNRLGAVESFRFDMIHTKTHNVERKTYRKNPYSLNVNTYNYSKQGHTLSNYLNETRERLVLNSNFITEEEAEWLQELVSSPKVWMYDGQIKGVTIVTNTYEEKQHVKDKVFNLTLEVEVSYYDVRR
jgi:hypothetical protein